MLSQKSACGYAVYNIWGAGGFAVDDTPSCSRVVQKPWFIPTLVNSFYTRFCTLVFDFPICFTGLVHPFHTPYNNHSFLKETNL